MATNLTTVLTTAMNKVVSLASSKVNKTAITKLYNPKSLTTTVTNGTWWTDCTASVTLAGNSLRIEFSGTRSTATGDGNITNEAVCTLTINTAGYISQLFNSTGISGTSGDIASFYTTAASLSGNTLTLNIGLSATAGAITSTNGVIYCAVVLNSSAYL